MPDGENGRTRIGSFTLIRPLGNGGMGNVSLARSDKDGQLVALKRLSTSGAHGWAQLRRGAKAAQRLDHDAVAKIYSWGQDGNIHYVVGEYVDGKDLQEVFAAIAATSDPHLTLDALWDAEDPWEGPIQEEFDGSSDEAAPAADDFAAFAIPLVTTYDQRFIASKEYINACSELIMKIANGLDHAHKKGVIHRDIKPANLMITRDLRVKIIDFGVARHDGDPTITSTEAIIGTPAYMSPEQIKGDTHIGSQSDIFSLGVVLYEALTLDRPHAASTAFGIMAQIANRRIKPIRWKNANIPESLESIVHKATALSPADRYASAGAMAEDLRRHLDGQSVTARPYRYALDMREIASRRPLRVLLSVVFYFFQAIIMLMLSPGVALDPSVDITTRLQKYAILTFLFTCSLSLFALGRGVLVARVTAPILSCVASIFMAGFFLFIAVVAFMIKSFNPFMLVTVAFIIVINLFIFVALLTPTARAWFRESQAIREGYRRPSLR